jgi:pantoate--beta-alanine ligase
MKTFGPIAGLSSWLAEARGGGRRVGLVPTMGFLHEGHLSLVRASRRRADITVASIFVNPLQFGPREDFKEYPRDLDRDSRLLEGEGVDALFCPTAEEMYPSGFQSFVEVCDLQDKLCGRSRPGHFRGVCTVVLKLLEIVRPQFAYFGQKDAQQALIIKRMASDFNLAVSIEVEPIVREPDGLALSSRNTYLSPEERKAATVLWRSLEAARRAFDRGERRAPILEREMRAVLEAEPLARLDYLAIVSPETLEPVSRLDAETLLALAVYVGRTRLIDNILFDPGRSAGPGGERKRP